MSAATTEVLTAEEIAKELRISPQTVKNLAKSGEIKGFKVGRQWRFDSDVLAAIRAKTQTT